MISMPISVNIVALNCNNYIYYNQEKRNEAVGLMTE